MKIKDMIRQALSVVIVMLSGMQITYAQSITVRGNVRDDVEPLMGVLYRRKVRQKLWQPIWTEIIRFQYRIRMLYSCFLTWVIRNKKLR